MQTHDVTEENFASIIMCDSTRSQLLSAMRAETGTFLPLLNHVSQVARRFETNRKQLSRIVKAELDAKCDDFLRDLVFHPEIDDSTLFQVYDSELCTVDLAHRSGPPSLLERIAKEQRIEEAVLSLLLHYYATDDYTESQFVQFVQAYGDLQAVRCELENKQNIPEHKRRLGLEVLAQKPK